MLYAEDLQTIAAGSPLSFTGSAVNSPTGAITSTAANTLTLAPGQYLVSFVSDASITEAGTVGAALALNGAALSYGTSALTASGPDADRIAITAIVSPTASSTLTVINNSGSTIGYENSTLTVVRLA